MFATSVMFFIITSALIQKTQAQACPCKKLGLNITWTQFGECTRSAAKCVGTQTRGGFCLLGLHDVPCSESGHPCTLADRNCASSWSKWSVVGRCTARCGIGTQPISRQCYYVSQAMIHQIITRIVQPKTVL